MPIYLKASHRTTMILRSAQVASTGTPNCSTAKNLKMKNPKQFQLPIIILCIGCLFKVSLCSPQTGLIEEIRANLVAKKAENSTCLTACTTMNDCKCEALDILPGKHKPRYSNSERACVNSRCQYCYKYREGCSTLSIPEYGIVPCCSTAENDKYNLNLACRNFSGFNPNPFIPSRPYQACATECEYIEQERLFVRCLDKDGYLLSHRAVECSGSLPNTIQECVKRNGVYQKVECGFDRAACETKENCCAGYKCDDYGYCQLVLRW